MWIAVWFFFFYFPEYLEINVEHTEITQNKGDSQQELGKINRNPNINNQRNTGMSNHMENTKTFASKPKTNENKKTGPIISKRSEYRRKSTQYSDVATYQPHENAREKSWNADYNEPKFESVVK